MAAKRHSIVGYCGAIIGLLDDGSCVAALMLDVATLMSLLEKLLVILIVGYLRCWSGFEM